MGIEGASTRDEILNVAAELFQRHGYVAVSYRDLADRVGIKTASIHYHYPTKSDLGQALVRKYRGTFASVREQIDARGLPPIRRLEGLVQAMENSLRQGERMCLCAVFAAESGSLPPEVMAEVSGFFTDNEAWIAGVLRAGVADGSLRVLGDANDAAKAIFAGLEGAMTTAWNFRDPDRLTRGAAWLLGTLKT